MSSYPIPLPPTPEVQELAAEDFAATYPPAYYAGNWDDVATSDDFLAGGDTAWELDDLCDSVAEHGITAPVVIENGEVTEGHHRVVAALRTGQPVRFRVWGEGDDAEAPMTFGEADDLTHAFFNSEEGADYEECCLSPDWAKGMCSEVSEAFADHLHRSGHTDAVTLDLIATDDHPHIWPGTAHTVVEVSGTTVIDLTYLQFDPAASVPHVAALADYLTGWRVVGRD